MLIGDAGGTLNVFKIKGIHQAIRSGSLVAAEHLVEHGKSAGFDARWRASEGGRELHAVRNFKPAFKRGLYFAMANAGIESRAQRQNALDAASNTADWSALEKLDEYTSPDRGWVERTLPPRDRLASVFFAGNVHDESQPIHLKVHDTSICVDALHQGIRQSLRELLSRPACTRWWTTAKAAGDCRSTPRTACTARPATSRIRTRSSRGPRRKAARDRTTRTCNGAVMEAALVALARTHRNANLTRFMHFVRERHQAPVTTTRRCIAGRSNIRSISGATLWDFCEVRAERSAPRRCSRMAIACRARNGSSVHVSTTPKTCCGSTTTTSPSSSATSAASVANCRIGSCAARSRASPKA